MSLRDRVISILNGKAPDRLPWYGDLSYWHFAMAKKGCLEKRYRGFEGVINLHRDLRVGFYLQGYYPFIHMDGYLKGLLKEVSTAGFLVIEAMHRNLWGI